MRSHSLLARRSSAWASASAVTSRNVAINLPSARTTRAKGDNPLRAILAIEHEGSRSGFRSKSLRGLELSSFLSPESGHSFPMIAVGVGLLEPTIEVGDIVDGVPE